MKFSGKIGNGPTNKRLNFGGDPDHRLQGLFSGFVTIGRYGKWNGVVIATMTSLRHRPTTEVPWRRYGLSQSSSSSFRLLKYNLFDFVDINSLNCTAHSVNGSWPGIFRRRRWQEWGRLQCEPSLLPNAASTLGGLSTSTTRLNVKQQEMPVTSTRQWVK